MWSSIWRLLASICWPSQRRCGAEPAARICIARLRVEWRDAVHPRLRRSQCSAARRLIAGTSEEERHTLPARTAALHGCKALALLVSRLTIENGSSCRGQVFAIPLPGVPTMTVSTFATAIDDRYFEDYVDGSVFEFGPMMVDEDEIIAFAQRFDPQPMHVDPKRAALGPFRGLIASGWHTVSLMMRLFVDHYLSAVASLASPGVDEIRWVQPVRPGDQLRLRVSVVESRPSRSKPDRGIVVSRLEAINQSGQVVCSLTAMNLLAKRPR